jgi:hypothetical protein
MNVPNSAEPVGETASADPAYPGNGKNAESEPTSSSDLLNQSIRFPVVRLCKSTRRCQQMVKLTPDSLVIGQVSGLIDDDLIHQFGNDAPDSSSVTVFPWQRIRRVAHKRFLHLAGPARWSNYDVETADGSHKRFRISGPEEANVNAVLRAMLGDRFQLNNLPRKDAAEVLSWVFAVTAMICFALSWANWHWAVVGVTLLVGPAAVLSAAWRRRTKPVQSRGVREGQPRNRPAVKPLYLPRLGLLLRLGGVVWFLLVAVGVCALFLAAPHASASALFRASLVAFAPGAVLLAIGYRLRLRTIEPRKHQDARAPILYLRGFDSDGSRRFSKGFQNWVFRAPCDEDMLKAAFSGCGPLRAIGKPGEWLRSPGADRVYVADDQWQQEVLDYLHSCRAVILQPSSSKGIEWEVDQAFARVARERILISLVHYHNHPNDYEEFCLRIAAYKISMPVSIPFRLKPCFVYFEPDGCLRVQELCHNSSGEADLAETFQAFIDGLNGSHWDRPSGLKARRCRWWESRVLTTVAALALGGALMAVKIFWEENKNAGQPTVEKQIKKLQEIAERNAAERAQVSEKARKLDEATIQEAEMLFNVMVQPGEMRHNLAAAEATAARMDRLCAFVEEFRKRVEAERISILPWPDKEQGEERRQRFRTLTDQLKQWKTRAEDLWRDEPLLAAALGKLTSTYLAAKQTELGASDPKLAGELALAGLELLRRGQYAAAEPVLRECLKMRRKLEPDAWTTFNAQSMLGGSLLGQKKWAAAEPLLREGFEGMKQREKEIPSEGKARLSEAVGRLVELYEQTGNDAEAARWRKELAGRKRGSGDAIR